MTKHKSPSDRRDQIIEAAAIEIAEGGYSSLTMDAIAARAGLSKGSVYRFFGNKKDVCLELYRRLFANFFTIDEAEILSWSLGPKDSLMRLFVNEMDITGQRESEILIWFSMLPEAMADADFKQVRHEETERIIGRLLETLNSLLARDGLHLTEDGTQHFLFFLNVGNMLMEGLNIERLIGTPLVELERRVAWLLHQMIDDALRGVSAGVDTLSPPETTGD